MKPRISSSITLSLLCAWGVGIQLEARESLILSLEEVIGEPTDRSEILENRKRDSFYSIATSERNSDIEDLIDQENGGIILTENDQERIREYRMGGSGIGSNAVMRKIYPAALGWLETRVEVASGKRYPFIKCTARADGPFPTALVLDPEITQQKEAGIKDYYRVIRGIPPEALLPSADPYRGRYATHSPLGNVLTAHTVSVILPINESIEEAHDISFEDWKSVIDYYFKVRDVEPTSFFLVATKEMADLALRLAAAYPFTGLILEEPKQALFGHAFPHELTDAVAMKEIQKQYAAILEPMTCKTFIFRQKLSSALSMNDQLLLKPLIDRQRPLFLGMTDVPMRRISQEDFENGVADPRFVYDTAATKKITQRMLKFVQQEGNIPLRILPEKSMVPRTNNRATKLINFFEQAQKRQDRILSEASAGEGTQNDSDGIDGGGF